MGSLNEYFKVIAAKREPSTLRLGSVRSLLVLFTLVYLLSFLLCSEPIRALPDIAHPVKAVFQVLLMQRDSALSLTAIVPMLIFLLFILELFARHNNPFQNIGWNVVAVVYILVPLILTNKMYFEKGGVFLVALFGIIWFYDSACYAFGSLFGRHKLFERVSPKKTTEGLIGGAIVTLAASYFLTLIPQLGFFSRVEWMLLSVVVIVGATFGDLVESLLKRSMQIKDSGSFMPGHGGFLDRFDAYFFTVPFVVFLLWIFTQAHNLMMLLEFVNQ